MSVHPRAVSRASRYIYNAVPKPQHLIPFLALYSTSTMRTPSFSANTSDETKASCSKLLEEGRWSLTKPGTGIERSVSFKGFSKAMEFWNAVADEAKRKKHHPEWANVYNRVIVRWTTHKPAGLSEKDLEMARFCDSVAEDMGEVMGRQDETLVATHHEHGIEKEGRMPLGKSLGYRDERVDLEREGKGGKEKQYHEKEVEALESMIPAGNACKPCATGKK